MFVFKMSTFLKFFNRISKKAFSPPLGREGKSNPRVALGQGEWRLLSTEEFWPGNKIPLDWGKGDWCLLFIFVRWAISSYPKQTSKTLVWRTSKNLGKTHDVYRIFGQARDTFTLTHGETWLGFSEPTTSALLVGSQPPMQSLCWKVMENTDKSWA